MQFKQFKDALKKRRIVSLMATAIAILSVVLTATAGGAILSVHVAVLTASGDSDLYAVAIQFETPEPLDDAQLATLDTAIEPELAESFADQYQGSSVVSDSRLALLFTGTIDLQQVAAVITPAFEQAVGPNVEVSVRTDPGTSNSIRFTD